MCASFLSRLLRVGISLGLAAGLAGMSATNTEAAPSGPPPVYVVDRTDDVVASACTGAANDCSLRGAVIAANSNPGAVIHTDAGSSYVLANTALGDLQALADMTIYPVGACFICLTFVQGGPGWTDRLMHVAVTATVVVSGMIWMNGNSNNGGAFLNEGQLDMHVSWVFSNTVGGWGGGILNDGGELHLYDSYMSYNAAGVTGGAIANQGGTVSIYSSSIYSNTSYGTTPGQGRGGALTNLNSLDQLTPGVMVISDTEVLSNTTPITMGLGGGIMSAGHVTILDSTLRANVAHDGGGLLVSAGYLTMTATTVMSNTANGGGGGGLYNDGVALLTSGLWQGNVADTGGGILNNLGDMAVWSSQVLSNTATGGGGGIRSGGPLDMTNVTVQGNQSGGSGGGIVSSSDLSVAESIIHDNAGFQGGGVATSSLAARVWLDDTQVTSNSATYGGGLAGFGTFTLTHGTQVSNNTAFQGGGANVFSTGRLVALGGEINGNTISGGGPGSAAGGGIDNAGSVLLQGVELSGNETQNGSGGGLHNRAGATAELADAEVVSNTASHDGGGLANAGTLTVTASAIISNTAAQVGGGITTTGNLNLLNTTLSGNEGGLGGGVWNEGAAQARFTTIVGNEALTSGGGGLHNTGVFTVGSVLLASNNSNTQGEDCEGTLASTGYNLLGDTDECNLDGGPDQLDAFPMLEPLALVQGTWVHDFSFLSPALDAGDQTDCPATDQAGNSRPIYAGCDVGAFESLALAPFRLFLPLVMR